MTRSERIVFEILLITVLSTFGFGLLYNFLFGGLWTLIGIILGVFLAMMLSHARISIYKEEERPSG